MPSEPSDFNDLAAKPGGKRRVAEQIGSIASADKAVATFGPFEIRAAGVYWTPAAKKDDEAQAIFFCSFLRPLGLARTTKGTDYALLLEMKNPDHARVQFLLRLEDLQLAGGEVARIEFARRGGYFGTGIRARQLFQDFINAILKHSKNISRLLLADRTGWLRQGSQWAYVLPDTAIGGGSEKIIMQQATTSEAQGYEVSGSLVEWGQQVGRYCCGNSRLIMAVCVALSGPLLAPAKQEGGGVAIIGGSSEGKTTALHVASSVAGMPGNAIRTLDATKNALEGAAALCNDGTLFLDEQGMAAPDALAAAVYTLASGQGRGRADQRGDLRASRKFLANFITTGEIGIEAMLKGIGKRPAAGQMLRLADIPASPVGGHGLFEMLHGFASGAALSDHLRLAVSQYYGAPLRAFLEVLARDLNQDSDQLRKTLLGSIKSFVDEAAPSGSDGQVVRVAARFGLLAAAGEYAARHGLLPWPEGEASWGVRECFNAWLQRRGGHGPLEVKNLLETFEGWLQANGEARFTPMDGDVKGPARPIINRAGFRRSVASVPSDESGMEYFIFPAAFKEAIGAAEPRWAARVLVERGWLEEVNGITCINRRMPGMGAVRVYHVPARFDGEI